MKHEQHSKRRYDEPIRRAPLLPLETQRQTDPWTPWVAAGVLLLLLYFVWQFTR